MRLADVIRKLCKVKRPRAVVLRAPGDFALVDPREMYRWEACRIVGVYSARYRHRVACDAAVTEQQLGLLRAA